MEAISFYYNIAGGIRTRYRITINNEKLHVLVYETCF